ncbi:MAG: two-component regulator propeller domain-containing protein, partial [Planctomycetota bacterium]
MNAISRELLIQQRDAGLRSSRLTVRWRRGAARILCAWVAFLPTSLYGSTESLYEAWRWVRFTTDSGLPSDRVYDVIETPDGTVWAATEKGLAWYDGFQWHPVGKSAGLPEMRAISLTADDRDSLVVLVDGVAYMGDKQGFDRVSIPGRDANTEVTAAVAFGERGALILVREPDAPRCLIYQWKGGVAQPLTPQPDLPNIRQGRLWKARNGSIWVQATGGFYRWDGEEWVLRLDAQDGRFNIRAFCENSGNTGLAFVEFSFRQRGLMSWTDGGPIKPASEPADTRLISMDIKPNGDAIAVHWSHGVHLRTGGAWRRFEPVPRELQSVTFVRYRPNGDLWVGTQRGLLLHRASDTRWTHQRHGPPDRDNHVLEFLKTRRGDLWIGTGKNIEIHRRDGAEEAIDRIGETKAGTITGLAEDTEGNVWISSGYCFPGAFRWDGTSWRHFGKQDGLDAPRVHKIRNDRQGRLWLLGIGDYPDYTDDGPGAFVYEHGRFTRWGKPEGLPNGRVYAFAETTDGARWFGTAGGLSRWRNGTWTHWNRDSGLASHRVYTIAVDLLDRVWFGHQTGGLGVIDETDRPKYLTTSDGLVNNEIWDLKVDPFNRLWAATEDGLCAYQDGDWMFYHSESGLGIPRLISVLPLRDEVYVGTAGGTTILDMSAAGRHPPRVVLQSPNIGHDSTLLRWAAHAHWGEIPPNEVETRYRLDGGAWS